MNELIRTNTVVTSLSSRKMLGNDEHIVVPVVALKEGVLNGVFYSKEEIKTFSQSWNGVPVPVAHPKKSGIHVSANSPEFEETVNIGKFFNVNYSEGKLKGEIWINIEKATRLGFEDIINHFDNGEMMEVSTGLFSETEKQPGIYNNNAYDFVAKNIRPDHLALLPNETGACSIEDGCGAMRTNKEDSCCDDCEEKEIKTLRSKWHDALKTVGSKIGLFANTASHDDVRRQINNIMDAERKKGDPHHWIIEVYEDYFIYEIDFKLYKRNYSEENGLVTLESDSVEVVRKTEYVAVTGLIGNSAAKPNSTEVNMTGKEEIVASLIANKATQYTEDDKESLLSLDNSILEKMEPIVNEKEEETESNKEPEVEANTLSNDDMALFNRLKANEENRVNDLRKSVVDGYEHISKEIVANMDVAAIEALAKGIKPAADFSARGGAAVKTNSNTNRKPPAVLLTNEEEESDNG